VHAGRSSNIVDANFSVLREKIQVVKMKERLQGCCCKRESGWNYVFGYNYMHKKEELFVNQLASCSKKKTPQQNKSLHLHTLQKKKKKKNKNTKPEKYTHSKPATLIKTEQRNPLPIYWCSNPTAIQIHNTQNLSTLLIQCTFRKV
jgi:hypothetical protein